MSTKSLHSMRWTRVALLTFIAALCQSCLAQKTEKRAALESEMKTAMDQVREIVNQPVPPMSRTPEMRVSTYRGGWFHQGATKPHFSTVEVSNTQDTNYSRNEFVTSDLNPGLVWYGSQLEFNPMTKYFYTDYSLPKKRLTEAEMLEINRLYRVIGRCEQELAEL